MNTEEIPKPHNADADPVKLWGRLPLSGKRALSAPAGSAGVLVTACAPGKPDATRETQRRGESRRGPSPTREGRNGAQLGVGEAHSTEGNRVTPVEGRGLSLGTRQEEMTAGRLAKAYQLHLRSENLRQPCVPKRRERRAIGSTACTIKSAAKKCCDGLGNAAVKTADRPESTGKASSRSKVQE